MYQFYEPLHHSSGGPIKRSRPEESTGAQRTQLTYQFIGESLLLTFISCLLSIAILQLLMPIYNQLLGYTLTVSWDSWPIYVFLVAIIFVVGLLAGSYPAFYLSTFLRSRH
ncbi:ABC transporter permease [Sphingobacterium sp. E70]|uniref:ABC transporter permease n=1 Tax=Sphingobacterium sp. E70 TaxID=2853439 RepID=UPI0027962994|nr:ABC transporter permease [Sphingobacterium sp. E70]